MNNLDMQTALLIYTVTILIGLFIMLFFQVIYKEKSNKSYNLLLYFIFTSIGSILIFYRDDLSLFVSVIIANLALFVGLIFFIFGVRKLLSLENNKWQLIIPTMIFTSLFVFFTYVLFNVLIRIVIYSLLSIASYAYVIYSLSKWKQKEEEIAEFMSPILLLIIVVLGFRIFAAGFIYETGVSFLNLNFDPFIIVFLGFFQVSVIGGYISLFNANNILLIRRSKTNKESILSNLPGFAFSCLDDEFWTMKYISEGVLELTGYESKELIDNNKLSYTDLICEEYRDQIFKQLKKFFLENQKYQIEYEILTKSGNRVWVWEQGNAIYNVDGEIAFIEGLVVNITTRKNLELNLKEISYKDELTGLYNRRYIEEQLIRLDNSRNYPISLIIGDINGLKFINDSFGHEHGDMLIKTVADIFKSTLRSYEMISRLGGDEFLVILENTSYKQTEKIVQRFSKKCETTKYLNMGLSVSLGYATKENKYTSLEDARKLAEENMYKQKMYSKPSSRRKTVDAVLTTLFEKSPLSRFHSEEVGKLSRQLATKIGLNQEDIIKAETAGLLHDVGKIIIDKSILLSDTLLTDDEYEEMQKHSEIGYRILQSVEEFKDIADIILCHHEKPDGTGYPNKITNENIPLISKIISICDSFDAMVNKRLYKNKMSIEEAIIEINRCKGTQFDETIVEHFVEMVKNSYCA